MIRLAGRLEGLILFALGAYMAVLSVGGEYGYYLNPKFRWVTASAAAVLIVVGAAVAILPSRRPRLLRILIFAVFLGFMAVEDNQALYGPRVDIQVPPKEHAAVEARLVRQGREYIKINTGELAILAERNDPEKTGLAYVLRGMVRRTPDLDRLNQFALVRLHIVCCLADAVGVGFRVRYDGAGDLDDGTWVQVFGTLDPSSSGPEAPKPGSMPGAVFVVLSDKSVLAAHAVVPIDPPGLPFVFDLRESEPYAY